MKEILVIAAVFCAFSVGSSAWAQKSNDYTRPDKLFLDGKEFYDAKQYGAAYHKFNEFLNTIEKDRSSLYGETEYFLAVCAYELGKKDARKRLETFLKDDPSSVYADRAHFLEGTIHYNREDYADAVKDFEACKVKKLPKDEQADYLFRSGYAYLETNSLNKAQQQFSVLLSDSTRYNLSAKYYKAYIDYVNKDYELAYPVFEELQNEESYDKIVPYYLFQIYYAQRKYDKVLESGENLLKKDSANINNTEVYRILGECYYHRKDYQNTIKYLSFYQEKSDKVVRDNMYMLGNSYYQMGDYVNAIESFQSVTSVEDAMSQNAYLYLGSCYVKDENLSNARLCFESAARMNFEKNVKEEAQFNYALIIYQQSYSPFNESITAFENFLKEFPDSRYRDKVFNYMVNLYLTTKNYKAALASIQNIEDKTLAIYEARQRISYCLGIQDFNNGNYESAVSSFNESLKDKKYNNELAAEAIFWRGEANYKLKEYDKAASDFNSFVNAVGARNCKEFNLAHYNIGYANFTKKQYANALTWFRKYINLEETNQTLIADATNRIGDCYFNQRDFDNAAKNYAHVYSLRGPGADYACFQEGFILGLQKDYSGKISTLEKLIKSFPQSEYLADAQYEIGRAYTMMGQSQSAISTYEKLNKQYPHSPLSRKGQLQTAMLYDEMGNSDKAVYTYKEIIKNFPNSAEAKTSIGGLKNIYFEKNDIQSYANYVESLNGLVKFEKSEQDSLTYMAAFNQYEKGKYENAIKSFYDYIAKFPNSMFVHDAHFNIANSYYNLNQKENAEPEYQIIANQVGSPNRETSLARLSEIQYEHKRFSAAIQTMSTLDTIAQNAENKLAARIGILRCNNLLGNTEETITAATTIISSDKLDPSILREALYTRAKAYEFKGDSVNAFTDYTELSSNCMDEFGAIAKYSVAEYYYNDKEYKAAEKEIFDFIDRNTPHQYWLAKSFILLADIYADQGREFEAKQYLLSVRENYGEKDDIADTIRIRLEKLEKKEAEKVVNTENKDSKTAKSEQNEN